MSNKKLNKENLIKLSTICSTLLIEIDWIQIKISSIRNQYESNSTNWLTLNELNNQLIFYKDMIFDWQLVLNNSQFIYTQEVLSAINFKSL